MADTTEFEDAVDGLSPNASLASGDKVSHLDVGAAAGSKWKTFTLGTLLTWLQTQLASTFLKLDMSNGTGTPYADVARNDGNTGATYEPDLSTGRVRNVTVDQNTVWTYTNAVIGYYLFTFTMGGAGSYTLSLTASEFAHAGAGAPSLSSSPGDKDAILCYYNGSKMLIVSTVSQVTEP